MPLYDTRTWETQNTAGLNWWMNSWEWNNHTTPNDAYIPIKKDHIRLYPHLFQAKQPKIETRKRQNETIEIIWDDWTTMQWLLEWNQKENDIEYPKQISTSPNKNELGIYIRDRIWVWHWERVLKSHLISYWRCDITVSLIEEGVYYFDFSI
jgi:hypothetical protein